MVGVDDDEDLTVTYVLPYTHGLIAGNFASVVNRFGSLLDYVVQTFNEDGLIDFGVPEMVASVADAGSNPASGKVLH